MRIPQWFGLNLGKNKFTLTIVSQPYQNHIKSYQKTTKTSRNRPKALRLLGESDGRLHAITFYEPVAWFTDRLKSDEQCAQDIESLCHALSFVPITSYYGIKYHSSSNKIKKQVHPAEVADRHRCRSWWTGEELSVTGVGPTIPKELYNCLRQVLKINCSFFLCFI